MLLPGVEACSTCQIRLAAESKMQAREYKEVPAWAAFQLSSGASCSAVAQGQAGGSVCMMLRLYLMSSICNADRVERMTTSRAGCNFDTATLLGDTWLHVASSAEGRGRDPSAHWRPLAWTDSAHLLWPLCRNILTVLPVNC